MFRSKDSLEPGAPGRGGLSTTAPRTAGSGHGPLAALKAANRMVYDVAATPPAAAGAVQVRVTGICAGVRPSALRMVARRSVMAVGGGLANPDSEALPTAEKPESLF